MNCEICYECVDNLCYLECTHNLCYNCLIGIKKSLASKSNKPKCPWCRYNIYPKIFKKYDVTKDKVNNDYISPFLLLDEAHADVLLENSIQQEHIDFNIDSIYIPRNRHRNKRPKNRRRNLIYYLNDETQNVRPIENNQVVEQTDQISISPTSVIDDIMISSMSARSFSAG